MRIMYFRVIFKPLYINIRCAIHEIAPTKYSPSNTLFRYYSTDKKELVNCNIGTIGHIDHGKTTLTAAITKYAAKQGRSKYVSYEKIDHAPEEKARGITINVYHVGYQTAERRYSHTDCPGHADYIKNMIAGTSQMDGAIVVVAATDGAMPQTREHISLAKQIGVKDIILYINKADLVENDVIELVEMEMRDLLNEYQYDGDNVPVVVGSAKLALEGDKSEIGEPSIQRLLDTLDKHVTVPGRDVKSPFYCPIDNALSVPGRGTVCVGTIKRGTIRKKDTGVLMGYNQETKTAISDIQVFHKSVNEAIAGDNVGILLKGVKLQAIRKGMTFCAEKSVKLTNHVEAQLYLLSKTEGGRELPLISKCTPMTICETWSSVARIDLPKEIDMLMPGENALVKLTFLFKFPFLEGQKFSIRERNKTIATGIITKVILSTPQDLTPLTLKKMTIPLPER